MSVEELVHAVQKAIDSIQQAEQAVAHGVDSFDHARQIWGTIFAGSASECAHLLLSEQCRAELARLTTSLPILGYALCRYLVNIGAVDQWVARAERSCPSRSTDNDTTFPSIKLGREADVRSIPPPGVKPGWTSRIADNGKGVVYQEPGSSGNANMIRVMDATSRYPYGYVRFYNEAGQPVGLNGKPAPRSETHIPRERDGSYPTPTGW
ncbi:hypothetical protein AB8O38_08665 [Saccharomonospora xinjiangensis]|uniref:hypothetical protein n=1 Tax=Saccharomonospora xinjiangensis TaxID=75294 RepID=UPI00350F096A